MSVVKIRNWRTLLYRRPADAVFALTRRQRFSALNDGMAAILKVWRQIGHPIPVNRCVKNNPDKYIVPILFETTGLRLFWVRSPQQQEEEQEDEYRYRPMRYDISSWSKNRSRKAQGQPRQMMLAWRYGKSDRNKNNWVNSQKIVEDSTRTEPSNDDTADAN